MAGAATLGAEWQSSRNCYVYAMCFLCSLVSDVDEMGNVGDVVEFCDDQVSVESAVYVSVVVMDLVCFDKS